MPVASDRIGVEYFTYLDIASLRQVKATLRGFHKELAALSKKASMSITVNTAQVKKEVSKIKSALQAGLRTTKTGEIALKLKAVPESFGKIGGINQQVIKDYEKLFGRMGSDTKRLGILNNAFKTVNSQIAKQATVMDLAKKDGTKFYNSVSRVARVEELLTERSKKLNAARKARLVTSRKVTDMAKTLRRNYGVLGLSLKDIEGDIKRQITPWNNLNQAYKNTTKEYKNFAAEQSKGVKTTEKIKTVTQSNTSALRAMGITSKTSLEQLKKMNLTGVEYSRIAKLTANQIKRLETTQIKGGKATAIASQRYDKLTKRLAFANFKIRQQEGILGDSMRATERWSAAGMKAMILSQTAWIASGAVIFGVLSTIRKGITDFMDFNQGLTDAAAITQATSTGFAIMEKAAMKAFTSSIMGAKEATDALKILGQAGMDARDAAVALETVYKVTTATGGETTEVVKFLTTALNVWNISAKDAAKVGNILGAALNYSKLEVEDLGTAFNYVANIANLVGMSITDLAATIAVLSNAGIRASTIGTGLRGVLSKLMAPTPKFLKQLKAVDLSIEDVNIRTTDLFVILKRLQDADFDITKIFKGLRRREAAALATMLNMGSEAFVAMSAALKDTTAVEIMFERSMAGLKNQIILTGHKIQALIIDALKISKPIIIGTTKTIRALTDSLRELSPVLIAIGVAFAGWQIYLHLATMSVASLTAATSLLGKTLGFISNHPIFAAITALIIGWTAVKAITDALNVSTKEKLSLLNREIDDLRKLQVLMLDGNRTDEDKLKILADYAKDYPELLKFLEQETLVLDDLNDALKKILELRKEDTIAIKKQDLALKESRLAWIEAKEEQLKTRGLLAKGWYVLFEAPKIGKLKEDIKALKAEIAALEGKGPKIIPGEFVWTMTPEMEEAFEKLQYERKSALEQAKIDYIAELKFYKLTEKAKTDEDEDQKAIRLLLHQNYQDAIKKINADAAKEEKKALRKIIQKTKKELDEAEKVARKLLNIKKEYTDREWELRKAAMKAHFKDEDDYRQWLGEEEFKREKQRLADTIKLWEKYYKERKELILTGRGARPEEMADLEKIKSFIEKLKKLEITPPVIYDPSDFAAGAKKGWKEATKDLTDEYKIWEDATEGTAQAMSDTLSDVFFDGMKNELKSAGDYWRMFTNTVKRYIAEIAASWVLFGGGGGWKGLIGLGASLVPGGGGKATIVSDFSSFAHTGGLQRAKKMHSGGLASNEMLRILKDKEFVIRDTSVNRTTQPVLDFINRTGKVPQTQAAPVYNNYYYVDAIDPESFDKILRDRGSAAIHDISLGSFAYARNKRDRRVI